MQDIYFVQSVCNIVQLIAHHHNDKDVANVIPNLTVDLTLAGCLSPSSKVDSRY